jgi:hypothetical protein
MLFPFCGDVHLCAPRFLLAEPKGERDLHRIVHLLATQSAQAAGATEVKVWVLPGGQTPKDLGGNGAAR